MVRLKIKRVVNESKNFSYFNPNVKIKVLLPSLINDQLFDFESGEKLEKYL